MVEHFFGYYDPEHKRVKLVAIMMSKNPFFFAGKLEEAA